MKKLSCYLTRFAITALLFVFAVSANAQCAMCRATVENQYSSGEGSLAAGLNMGIIYLMLIPYVLLFVTAVMWYKRSKAFTEQKALMEQTLRLRRS
jgi:hypothetical protein